MENPSDERLKEILDATETIASVGLSGNEDKPSHWVGLYLMGEGFRVIPVNPTVDKILGEKTYPDLESIPEKIDVVQLFRPSEAVMPFVESAIKIGAKVVWMQEGIVNEDAAEKARAAGLEVVMDACMRATHRNLCK
jgi:predicted CoA-binding protein